MSYVIVEQIDKDLLPRTTSFTFLVRSPLWNFWRQRASSRITWIAWVSRDERELQWVLVTCFIIHNWLNGLITSSLVYSHKRKFCGLLNTFVMFCLISISSKYLFYILTMWSSHRRYWVLREWTAWHLCHSIDFEEELIS